MSTLSLRAFLLVFLWIAHVSRRFVVRWIVSILLCFLSIYLAHVGDFPRCWMYFLTGMTYLIDPDMRWVVVVDVMHSVYIS